MDKKRVLVADDEESIRELVVRALSRGDYVVESATDGAEAIERLQSGTFDAMVLDLMMPRVTGFGVLEYVRENRPGFSARTIVITAYPRTGTKELSGLCQVLPKPFDLDQLLSAVARCSA